MKLFLGGDPGESGAIATVSMNGQVEAVRLESTEHEVSEWVSARAQLVLFGLLELVNAFPKQGVSSTFKFGKSYGFVRGLLFAHKIPFEEVSPVKWKAKIGGLIIRGKSTKSEKKAKARAKVQQLFPYTPFEITNHTADAILIAETARRVWAERYGRKGELSDYKPDLLDLW